MTAVAVPFFFGSIQVRPVLRGLYVRVSWEETGKDKG